MSRALVLLIPFVIAAFSSANDETPPSDVAATDDAGTSTPQEENEGAETTDTPWWEAAEVKQSRSQNSLCAHVTCSYRGRCIVVNNAPRCACSSGYITDRNNPLACIPAAALKGPSHAGHYQNRPGTGWSPDEEMAAALGGYDVAGARRSYNSAQRKGEFDGAFHEYLKAKFEQDRLGGAIALTVGVVMVLGAIGIYVPAVLDENAWMWGLGSGIELTGIVFIVIGSVATAKATKRLDRLKSYRRRFTRDFHLRLHPALTAAGTNAAAGYALSLGMRF